MPDDPQPAKKITLKSPQVNRQRQWVRAVDYRVPERQKAADRTLDDLRLRRFKQFQPPLGRNLRSPVEVDEARAKALAGKHRFPIFEDGELSHHEDTVREVLDELDNTVSEVLERGDYTESQAQEIRRELEKFRALAKAAYESAHKSDVLAEESNRLAEESKDLAFLRGMRREDGKAPAGVELAEILSDPELLQQLGVSPPEKRPTPAPEPTPEAGTKSEPSGAGQASTEEKETPKPKDTARKPHEDESKPPIVRAQLAAEASLTRAKLAKQKADQAKGHAQDAAKKSQEMRKSLERLRGLVGDAALTAHGLPENKDTAANKRVEKAQAAYRDVYGSVHEAYTTVNARLDRAFWVTQNSEEAVTEAVSQKETIALALRDSGKKGATEEELAEARAVERRDAVGRAPSTVVVQAARFFRDARPPRIEQERVPLKAEFDKFPAPPTFKAPPKDVDGKDRPYQAEIQKDLDATGDDESVLVVAPTGAGKTVIFAKYIAKLRRRGKTVAVMAHTKELIDQASVSISRYTGEAPGIVQGHSAEWDKPVTVISHGTVVSNPYGTIPKDFKPDVFIVDEAHHAAADGFQGIIRAVNPNKVVGFTATPYRADGLPLDKTFETVICRVETADLVEQGYLVPPTVVDVNLTDAQGGTRSINEASNLPELYAEGISRAKSVGRKKIIVFVSSGENGRATDIVKETTAALNGLGVPAGEVLGSTNEDEREEAIAQFKRRRQGVLINYGTLNEGFDAPSSPTA